MHTNWTVICGWVFSVLFYVCVCGFEIVFVSVVKTKPLYLPTYCRNRAYCCGFKLWASLLPATCSNIQNTSTHEKYIQEAHKVNTQRNSHAHAVLRMHISMLSLCTNLFCISFMLTRLCSTNTKHTNCITVMREKHKLWRQNRNKSVRRACACSAYLFRRVYIVVAALHKNAEWVICSY